MSTKLSTKNIAVTTGGGTPKLLQPGNQVIKINSVTLDKFTFREGGLHVLLNVEGPDLGSDFEGFNIDKLDPAKSKYKGQIGRIKANSFGFADATVKDKSGKEIVFSRDTEMLKFLVNLCNDLGISDWLDKQHEKHDTVVELYEQFNVDKPFANKWIRACIGGKEYTNGQGYTNYDLFIPKSTSKAVAMELDSVPEVQSRLIKYSENTHIVRKSKPTPVAKFGDTAKPVAKKNTDFDL
jgi:hypothetical protein